MHEYLKFMTAIILQHSMYTAIASCVHTGEKATVSFVATLEFTYEFAVVAEDNPNQLVLGKSTCIGCKF